MWLTDVVENALDEPRVGDEADDAHVGYLYRSSAGNLTKFGPQPASLLTS